MAKKSYLDFRPLASASLLRQSYEDFILSRAAMRCTDLTMEWYSHTAGAFVAWLELKEVVTPKEIDVRLVRMYLNELNEQGRKDNTVNGHARAIRTFVHFLFDEHYVDVLVKFKMPKVEGRRQPDLSAAQVETLLKVASKRDKALVALMVDTGLRRSEVIALNWGDLDFSSGVLQVVRGKGGKARTAVIGPTTRRALLAYFHTLEDKKPTSPMFQTQEGERFSGEGFLMLWRRLSRRSGIHVSPHMLRRTFAILALRSGMSVLHLQALMGHSSLEMVRRYAQLIDDDLIDAHKTASPMENLSRLK